MKSRDTFAPIGPYIVTADEIKEPHKLQIKLTNNGVVMQNFNTDDMAHKIPRCIEWVTSIHTLQPASRCAALLVASRHASQGCVLERRFDWTCVCPEGLVGRLRYGSCWGRYRPVR
jgi:hypothetical protein